MVELLARTGMRVGELAALEDDAMVQISETFWLRIPVGKLHNDRYVPLLPLLVDLIDDYRAHPRPEPLGSPRRPRRRPALRPADHPPLRRSSGQAGRCRHVHPHQLRHTLATQAINRGMSLEAIAALLGHRSMDMTMIYARISDRTVADEYFRVTEAVEANYGRTEALPDDAAGANMRKLAADHRRMLGNGMCTRPVALDCSFESACERCTFFETGPQFIPILRRQRDHADEQEQTGRAELFSTSSRTSTGAAECGSIAPSPGPGDHPCNNTSATPLGGKMSHGFRREFERWGLHALGNLQSALTRWTRSRSCASPSS